MNDQTASQPKVTWTWADMFVTYRFWGLMLFYLLSLASTGLVFSWFSLYLQEISPTSSPSFAGVLNFTVVMSVLLGFYLAWAATRSKTKTVLIIAGLFQLVGGFVMTYPQSLNIYLPYVGAILFGLGSGAITLGVPAILAGGKGGAQAFVVAFGLLFTLNRVFDTLFSVIIGFSWEQNGARTLMMSMAVLTVLGLIFLIPVKSELFTRPPKTRTFDWKVGYRSSVLVGLGSIIGVIYYYFIYKFHGEVASLKPSSKILSPWGAVFTLIIFPFAFATILTIIFLIIIKDNSISRWLIVILVSMVQFLLSAVVLTSLVEPLNDLAKEHGKKPILAPWIVFIFSFLIPPVAIGLIQWALNQAILISEQASNQPAAGNGLTIEEVPGVS